MKPNLLKPNLFEKDAFGRTIYYRGLMFSPGYIIPLGPIESQLVRERWLSRLMIAVAALTAFYLQLGYWAIAAAGGLVFWWTTNRVSKLLEGLELSYDRRDRMLGYIKPLVKQNYFILLGALTLSLAEIGWSFYYSVYVVHSRSYGAMTVVGIIASYFLVHAIRVKFGKKP